MIKERLSVMSSCLSASVAYDQDPSRLLRGRRNYVTKFLIRSVSPRLRQIMHSSIHADTLPVFSHDPTPLSFGTEAITWKVGSPNGNSGVFKVDRKGGSREPSPSVEKRVQNYNFLCQAFGDLVVPTSFYKVKQPYRCGVTAVGRAQEFIDFRADLFTMDAEQLEQVDREDMATLIQGIRVSLRAGKLPDLWGPCNTVVTEEGRIKILDGEKLVLREDKDRWHYALVRLGALYQTLEEASYFASAQSFVSSA